MKLVSLIGKVGFFLLVMSGIALADYDSDHQQRQFALQVGWWIALIAAILGPQLGLKLALLRNPIPFSHPRLTRVIAMLLGLPGAFFGAFSLANAAEQIDIVRGYVELFFEQFALQITGILIAAGATIVGLGTGIVIGAFAPRQNKDADTPEL